MGNLSKNFSRYEFACNGGCGFDTVDAELIVVVQDLRDHFDKPISITSGCRCAKYNKKVRGAKKSKHLIARAADMQVHSTKPREVADYLEKKYPRKYGIGRYRTFTHVDTRKGPARWGRN